MSVYKRFPEIIEAARKAFAGEKTYFSLISGDSLDKISFYGIKNPQILRDLDEKYEITEDLTISNILILNNHGLDNSYLWHLIDKSGFSGTRIIWCRDNHLGEIANLRSVIEADFVIPAHSGCSNYLLNARSVRGPTVPWQMLYETAEMATRLRQTLGSPRQTRVFGGYMSYGFAKRTNFLSGLSQHADIFDIKLNSREKQDTEYFKMSREDILNQWLSYKTSIAVPINGDLSPRIAMGLCAGQTVLVSDEIQDLDMVFPPSLRNELGIFKFSPSAGIEELKSIARQAVQVFDEEGREGVLKRHAYAMENHTNERRIHTILQSVEKIADGRLAVVMQAYPDGVGMTVDYGNPDIRIAL
ncbi:hypothetical protein J2847_006606 [Azospirillum agricola]|uniref:hypothetical protein n=1 Tax=Azospirillum agricola TaxID=1720247 RepID=UPI001AE515E6|nr:hypothetical protein [Azospirillum agricola]MBP2233269.1 hypothetical protein [Azospirillum agricola]